MTTRYSDRNERTYDSGTNTWVGNGVTSFSSDGSQSGGARDGVYSFGMTPSSIGWVPVATRLGSSKSLGGGVVDIMDLLAAPTVGPGVSEVTTGAGSAPEGGGPGAPGVVTVGEVTAGPGAPATGAAVGTGPGGSAARPRTTNLRISAVTSGGGWPDLIGVHNNNRLSPHLEDKATGGLMAGFSYEANPRWSNVEDWAEARYGDFGSVPFAIAVVGADIGYNARRAYDHLSRQPEVRAGWNAVTSAYDSSPLNPSNRNPDNTQSNYAPWEANATARRGSDGTVWRTGGGF